MKLAEFFEVMRPMLAGQVRAEQTARLLYGGVDSEEARRFEVYERMCRWRRADMLAGVFPRVHKVVLGTRDQRTWSDLCTAYYKEAPWTAIRPLPSAAGFSEFLARVHAADGLPDWLSELADFEWWAATTRSADDTTDDPATGPLRLPTTAELRLYRHDLVAWIDGVETVKREPPTPGQFVVLYWRDESLVACVRSVSTDEIRLLGAVQRGALSDLGEDEQEIVRRLHRIGALVGAAPWPDV